LNDQNIPEYIVVGHICQDLLPDGSLSLADEGTDAFGHVRLGGVGDRLAALIERRTGGEPGR
jgi:hypothetical protein